MTLLLIIYLALIVCIPFTSVKYRVKYTTPWGVETNKCSILLFNLLLPSSKHIWPKLTLWIVTLLIFSLPTCILYLLIEKVIEGLIDLFSKTPLEIIESIKQWKK